MADSLKIYRRKRQFKKTSEPKGGRRKKSKAPVFVVQKHAASRLHYDFRLESGGVLKSWAVPKGPSLNPKDKRLAVPTEDHPLEYANFEGIIPLGEYGGGVVMIWDYGTYQTLQNGGGEVPAGALKKGKIAVELHGKKLKGRFFLVRTSLGESEKRNWFLIKARDKTADPKKDIVQTKPNSVKSKLTLKQIALKAVKKSTR